jgi:predicted N-acetyltransferase YhbS
MIRIVAFGSLASLLLSPVLGDETKQPERTAAELLSAGVDQAKDQGKKVFLLFGSPG